MQKYVIALYICLSIEDYKYDSLSIENQRLVLHEYAAFMPEALNAEITEFIDNGYSGTNFERPQVQKLIELVRANQIDCIIVKDFSRFGRNSIETGYFIERVFPLFHTRFISISDDFDSSKFKGDAGGMDVAFKYLISEYYYRYLLREVVVSGVAICMEIATESCQELLWMLRTPSRLVLVQDYGLVRIPAGPIQPHVAVGLRLLSRLVENLQGGFIRMENLPFEQLRMQPVIYGSQIILRGPQDPVGHSLPAQLDAFPLHFLFLPVQGTAHDELLGHDVGNGLRCSKAAGDNILYSAPP